jgi:hypothetical protein
MSLDILILTLPINIPGDPSGLEQDQGTSDGDLIISGYPKTSSNI